MPGRLQLPAHPPEQSAAQRPPGPSGSGRASTRLSPGSTGPPALGVSHGEGRRALRWPQSGTSVGAPHKGRGAGRPRWPRRRGATSEPDGGGHACRAKSGVATPRETGEPPAERSPRVPPGALPAAASRHAAHHPPPAAPYPLAVGSAILRAAERKASATVQPLESLPHSWCGVVILTNPAPFQCYECNEEPGTNNQGQSRLGGSINFLVALIADCFCAGAPRRVGTGFPRLGKPRLESCAFSRGAAGGRPVCE